jgi:hypothetical protein
VTPGEAAILSESAEQVSATVVWVGNRLDPRKGRLWLSAARHTSLAEIQACAIGIIN